MIAANEARGERVVDLGEAGQMLARADHNAIAKIEGTVDKVPRLVAQLGSETDGLGFTDAARIIHACVSVANEPRDVPSFEVLFESLTQKGYLHTVAQAGVLLMSMVQGFGSGKDPAVESRSPHTH